MSGNTLRTTSPIAPNITVNTFRHTAQTDIHGETSDPEAGKEETPELGPTSGGLAARHGAAAAFTGVIAGPSSDTGRGGNMPVPQGG